MHLSLDAADLCWRQIPASYQAEGRRAARLSNTLIQLGNLHQEHSNTGRGKRCAASSFNTLNQPGN